MRGIQNIQGSLILFAYQYTNFVNIILKYRGFFHMYMYDAFPLIYVWLNTIYFANVQFLYLFAKRILHYVIMLMIPPRSNTTDLIC